MFDALCIPVLSSVYHVVNAHSSQEHNSDAGVFNITSSFFLSASFLSSCMLPGYHIILQLSQELLSSVTLLQSR